MYNVGYIIHIHIIDILGEYMMHCWASMNELYCVFVVHRQHFYISSLNNDFFDGIRSKKHSLQKNHQQGVQTSTAWYKKNQGRESIKQEG